MLYHMKNVLFGPKLTPLFSFFLILILIGTYNNDESKIAHIDKAVLNKEMKPFDEGSGYALDKVQLSTKKPVSPTFLRTIGAIIKVGDLAEAREFYINVLGFRIMEEFEGRIKLESGTDSYELWIEEVEKIKRVKYGQESHNVVAIQTNNLDSLTTIYKMSNVSIIKGISENGVGRDIIIEDPFGNIIPIIEQSKIETPWFEEPRVYNMGLIISDLQKGKAFYCDGLGFRVRSENYLPRVLPINNYDGSFAFAMHKKDVSAVKRNYFTDTQINFLLESNYKEEIIGLLKTNKMKWFEKNNQIVVEDPWGNYMKIISRADLQD